MYNQFCCSVYICLFDALSFSRTRTHNLSCKEIKKKEEGEGGGGGGRRYEEEEQEAIVSIIYRSWGLVFFFCPFFFGERSFFS